MSMSSSPRLVWVTQGKTQHAAFLLEESTEGRKLVRWATTDRTEWIDAQTMLERELTPRSRRQHMELSNMGSLVRSAKRWRPTTSPSSACNPRRISLDQPPTPITNTKTSKHAATKNGSTKIANECQQEQDDDSSVEVLLTIYPPSPKKKFAKMQPQHMMVENNHQNHDVENMTVEKETAKKAVASQQLVAAANSSLPSTLLEISSSGAAMEGPIPTEDSLSDNAALESASAASTEPQESEDMEVNLRKNPSFATVHTQNGQNSTQYSAFADELKPAAVTTVESASDSVDESTDHKETRSFSFVSSAYMQNLAEICHTILEDRRWRIGRKQEQLLSWQLGDDLTAVLPLARRFRPPINKRWKSRCHQLKSSCNEKMDLIEDNTYADKISYGTCAKANSAAVVDLDDGYGETDTPEDRSLYLYSRLFYRKGPWFRIDDIFARYYAPKQAKRSFRPVAESTGKASQHRSTSKNAKGQPIPDKQSFFLKRSTRHSTDKLKSTCEMQAGLIEEDVFQQHLKALTLLLEDLQRLKCMGLIRTFKDEEECGKTVGAARVLLTQEERRQVLMKLGCNRSGSASHTKRCSSTWSSSSSRTESFSSDNEIWKQMCQQQSISSNFVKPQNDPNKKANGTKPVYLPVSQHVSQVVLDKWMTNIVLACSPTEYIAAPVMKSRKLVLKNAIAEVISDTLTNTKQARTAVLPGMLLETALGSFGMCFRLREAPLRALQRTARLYLCATGGPGEMRSNGGTNGWKSIQEVDRNFVFNDRNLRNIDYAKNVEPPGAHSWHNVSYPGLMDRFGLASFCFKEAFEPLSTSIRSGQCNSPLPEQVFFSLKVFRAWEMSAEMRSNADYLMEINELLLYNERKRTREERSAGKENDSLDLYGWKSVPLDDYQATTSMDLLSLLDPLGRKAVYDIFLAAFSNLCSRSAEDIVAESERDINRLCNFEIQMTHARNRHQRRCSQNDCEEILCIIGVMIKNILAFRMRDISGVELEFTVSRPWLRHLSWEACLAYILWDIIPIFERRSYYQFAIRSLELLVYGSATMFNEILENVGGTQLSPTMLYADVHLHSKEHKVPTAFAHFLLSRRARGKALDRLMIDATHLIRQRGKTQEDRQTKKKPTPAAIAQSFVHNLSWTILKNTVEHASVSFSSIRTLSRRLKQPLSKTLTVFASREAAELGLRLANPEERCLNRANIKRYSDWTPITDYAVANSVSIGETFVGRRCSFVGHEDDENGSTYRPSLNVEQLAMEFYSSGRLPEQVPESGKTEIIKGGWKGWHDEGGMVRALFRVMCSHIMGMDWNCAADEVNDSSIDELQTIHISPYQGAPFDLHVGFELSESVLVDKSEAMFNRGFYSRRKEKIENFLSKLERQSPQEICDLVWDSIAARRTYMVDSLRKDPFLERDLLQTRTMSMVAAGFGGKMLAAMFRCFFFDYRHYSGGLPDLLLVRAKYVSTATFTNLGSFIGEAFDPEYLSQLEAEQRASLLGDRDNDFLGCSKVGDSGGGNSKSGKPGRQAYLHSNNQGMGAANRRVVTSIPDMPARLTLHHDGKDVEVETMFVEVKSLNDRLDARQEDWLNILDHYGNARVCKFSDGKGSQKNLN